MRDVVVWTIKAYELVGVLALENSLNQIGVDHVLMTRVAVAAVCTRALGGGRREVADAASQAIADGAGLRCFRHYPNNGTRKGWAAGDAASRGVWIALTTMRGEMGYRLVLSAPVWGFNDVFYRRNDLTVRRDFGSTWRNTPCSRCRSRRSITRRRRWRRRFVSIRRWCIAWTRCTT